jgi:uncharacterized OB-fold protein
MSEAKTRAPAVEGWFTMDPERPSLLGTRCRACGSYFFPPETVFCRNPACQGTAFEEVPLSRRGRLWSFTDNRYAPPAPYVAADPFAPYAIAAVELEAEQMVVLGQVVSGLGVEALRTGMEMELALGTLFEDERNEYVVWKWRPVVA